MKQFLKEWRVRLYTAPANSYKLIFKASVWTGGLGTALITAGDNVPLLVHTIATYLVTVGIVGGFLSKSTMDDPNKAKE